MPKVIYTSLKGFKPLGGEGLAALSNSYEGVISNTDRLTAGVWIGVNATISGTLTNVVVNTTSADGYAMKTLTNLVIGQAYNVYTPVSISTGGDASIEVIGGGKVTVPISGNYIMNTFTATSASMEVRLVNAAVGSNTFSLLVVEDGLQDQSDNSYGLSTVGTLSTSKVNTGTDLVSISGYTGSNYIRQQIPNSSLDFISTNTKDFTYMIWANIPDTTTDATIFSREYTSGSIFSASLVSGNLTFKVSDDFSVFDTITYTGDISDSSWHFLTFVCRNIYIGTALDAQVLEIWVDAKLVKTVNLVNATNILANGNARLTVGNNYAANAPLTGASLCMIKAGPYAALRGEIAGIFYNERELFTPYTALQTVGETYTLDIRYTTFDKSYSPDQSMAKSLSAKRVTTTRSRKYTWSIGTIPLNKKSTTLSIYEQFIYSVSDGTLFQFDPEGTSVLPNYDIPVYLDSPGYSLSRLGLAEYYSLSLNMVEA